MVTILVGLCVVLVIVTATAAVARKAFEYYSPINVLYRKKKKYIADRDQAKRVLSIMSKNNPNYRRWENIYNWRNEDIRKVDGRIEEYYIMQEEKKLLNGD